MNLCKGQSAFSLRFYGTGLNDADRVKIKIDPQVPIDVDYHFTFEFWMKTKNTPTGGTPNKGTVYARSHPPDVAGALYGNMIFDRDIYSKGEYGKYWISMGKTQTNPTERMIAFGVDVDGSGVTIVGNKNIADDTWHHVAITRNASTGVMKIFVDGLIDGFGYGPTGDVSYKDNRTLTPRQAKPPLFSGAWTNEPYLVIGAEKHDRDQYKGSGLSFPSYNGWLDEIRISKIIRYDSAFQKPTIQFYPDSNTVGLYHFNEGIGNVIHDSSGAAGGPSDGVRKPGGAQGGPTWSTDLPPIEFVPVELLSFQGSYQNDYVLLQWITASETNNYGFEIERMRIQTGEGGSVRRSRISSPKANQSIWETIGFVPGHGTINMTQQYSFMDTVNLKSSILNLQSVLYRLKQIDIDGAHSYSQTVEINFSDLKNDFHLDQNYPNPFTQVTNIDYRLSNIQEKNASFKIYDVFGREVLDLSNKLINNQPLTIDNSQLPTSGIYFYRLTIGNQSQTRMMMKR